MVLITHLFLVLGWHWVGAIPPPPLCAYIGMSWDDFTFTYHSFVHSFIHSIGMCRMRRFLAVLRSFFHSSLLCTLSFHPFPPTSLPSSLTSSCHLFPVTVTYMKYELVCWSLKGMLWGSEVFESLMSRFPKLDPWTAWIHLNMDLFRDWWYILRNKTFYGCSV
jgi:hypothetical protein